MHFYTTVRIKIMLNISEKIEQDCTEFKAREWIIEIIISY